MAKRSPNQRAREDKVLLEKISQMHEESRGAYGSRKITHGLNRNSDKPANHKRVERIMRENGIHSKTHKKYKATTNSRHSLNE